MENEVAVKRIAASMPAVGLEASLRSKRQLGNLLGVHGPHTPRGKQVADGFVRLVEKAILEYQASRERLLAKEKNNLTPEQCREKVTERHTDCERLATTEVPEKISDKATSKELGRKYLTCGTPYFFCNGVEVSTEDEARKHCQ